MYRAADLIAL